MLKSIKNKKQLIKSYLYNNDVDDGDTVTKAFKRGSEGAKNKRHMQL